MNPIENKSETNYAAPPRRSVLFRHPDFMKLWAGETVSLFGTRMGDVAISFAAVIALKATPFQIGLLAAAGTVPTLVLTGDEDWPCLAPSVLMKREIPSAALAVMPNCGHTINLEDPDLFNQIVGDFIVQVDAGRWPKRDPRAMSASITGMR